MKNASDINNTINQLQLEIDTLSAQLRELQIEQEQLKVTVQRNTPRSNTTPKRYKPKKKIQLGDTVRVISNHKGRKGVIGTVTGFRGTTQYVITTSSTAAEATAEAHGNKHSESFAVWKSNVVSLA